MKNVFRLPVRAAAVLTATVLFVGAAQGQGWQWATAATAPLNSRGGRPTVLALDAAGNTLVAGLFRDTLQCGATQLISAGRTDVFVGKLAPTGQWLWAVAAGGAGADSVSAIAPTPAGGAVIAGTSPGQTMIGPSLVPGAAGQSVLYVAQLSPAGQWQWVAAPTGNGSAGGALQSGPLATDALGRVWVSGQQSGFGGGTSPYVFGTHPLPAATTFAASFVACLSATGQWQWVGTPAGTQNNTVITQLAVDAAQNALYVGGNRGETHPACPMEFGVPHGFVGQVPAGTSGAWQWLRQDQSVYYDTTYAAGNPGSTAFSYSRLSALIPDGAGRLFIGGDYSGRGGADGPPAGALPARQSEELYVTALDASTGARQWSRATVSHNVVAKAFAGLAVTAPGDVTLVGLGMNMIPCGNGPAPPPPILDFGDSISLGMSFMDGFMVRFTGATGHCEWVQSVRADLSGVASNGSSRLAVSSGWMDYDAWGSATPVPPAGQYVSAIVASFNEAAPYVRRLSTYSAAPGTFVTVTGTHFIGATQVLMGGVPVAFTVVSATSIVFIVPPTTLTNGGVVAVVGPTGTGLGPYLSTTTPTGLPDALTAALVPWPNPATDVVRLDVGAVPADVAVLDGLGRAVRRFTGVRGTFALPVADLPAGTYAVRVGTRVARLVVGH